VTSRGLAPAHTYRSAIASGARSAAGRIDPSGFEGRSGIKHGDLDVGGCGSQVFRLLPRSCVWRFGAARTP
jgi:hypothetical protein